jgi:hypothetical protein
VVRQKPAKLLSPVQIRVSPFYPQKIIFVKVGWVCGLRAEVEGKTTFLPKCRLMRATKQASNQPTNPTT